MNNFTLKELFPNINFESIPILKKVASTHRSLIELKGISFTISGKCDYFITTDNGTLRKRKIIKEIKILNPLEFIENTFGGNYDDR